MENRDEYKILENSLKKFSDSKLDKRNPYKKINLEEVFDEFFESFEKMILIFLG